MKAGIVMCVAAALLSGCASVGAPAPGSLSARLVGTWRVEAVVDTDTAGKVEYPYGEHPKGYIVYDPTGHLHVQIMRTPATPPFAQGDQKGSESEVRAAYDGYAAYFGTYRVDEAQAKVIH